MSLSASEKEEGFPVAVVVVGGNTRNVGKTSVAAGLIARLPELHWTALKITQFGHGFCTADGKPCACQTAEACVAMNVERDAASGTDTSRFVAAGAARTLWVRTRVGQLGEAMPRIRAEIAAAENAIVESNSVLEFLEPDLYLTVIDEASGDFKESARRFLGRADAVVCAEGAAVPEELASLPRFAMRPPEWVSEELAEFVRGRVGARVG